MSAGARSRPAYSGTAAYYDRIYDWKDYSVEVREIERLVRRYGRPGARTLLDVGCGTGNHLALLRHGFEVTGVDASPGMLRVARRKLPGVRFVRSRMESLDLRRAFDVVTCLFGAIAYAPSVTDLRAAIGRIAAHLAPGGVAIVEPFLPPDSYRAGSFHAQLLGTADRPLVRMSRSDRRGARAVMDMHHLLPAGTRVLHVVEHHDLGLFERRTYLAAFRRAGLRARYLRGWNPSRGLYVAVRPKRRRA